MSEKQEADVYLRELEQENGGKVTYRTYCRLFGFSDGRDLDLGGLLYIIDDMRIIFEDFERENNTIASLISRPKKPYEKFKITRQVSQITNARYVSAAAVKRQLGNDTGVSGLRELTGWRKILFKPVIELTFDDTDSWYIELLSDKAFFEHVMKERRG
jgi:hypothetical protein